MEELYALANDLDAAQGSQQTEPRSNTCTPSTVPGQVGCNVPDPAALLGAIGQAAAAPGQRGAVGRRGAALSSAAAKARGAAQSQGLEPWRPSCRSGLAKSAKGGSKVGSARYDSIRPGGAAMTSTGWLPSPRSTLQSARTTGGFEAVGRSTSVPDFHHSETATKSLKQAGYRVLSLPEKVDAGLSRLDTMSLPTQGDFMFLRPSFYVQAKTEG